ncbi:MAG: 50S ribosomal protein L29 [Euryarchaeota archaeon RBG_16_62_10]|nr:MAG: 50S ribosomal protein L29 [Euryarchaeota archaeon RBG_16_62_10]
MALIRPKEIRAMRPDDIRAKFKELSDELMHERGVAAMGGAPASPGKIRALRKNVARIHTIMREMQVAEAVKAAAKAPADREEKAKGRKGRAEPAQKPKAAKKESRAKKEDQEEKK